MSGSYITNRKYQEDNLSCIMNGGTPAEKTCVLDQRETFDEHSDYYFIVRKDKWDGDPLMERVCLYRIAEPKDVFVSNELREDRTFNRIYKELLTKIEMLKNRILIVQK